LNLNTRKMYILYYTIIIIIAVLTSYFISPFWGGTVLFWVGIAAAVFFVFALLGTIYGNPDE